MIELVYVEAVLMDNGELIHKGKTLGYHDKKEGTKPKSEVRVVEIR